MLRRLRGHDAPDRRGSPLFNWRRPPGLLAAAVMMTTVLSPAGRAEADEDDWQIAGRAGIASVVVDGRNPFGFRLGVDGQYGLTDAWAVRLTAVGSRHGVSADTTRRLPDGSIYAYSVFAGLAYTLDVLRLLPSFEIGAGVLGIDGAVLKPRKAFGMQASIAADYLLGPRFSVGGVAEYVFAPFDLISNALNGNAVPQAFALSARVCWIIR